MPTLKHLAIFVLFIALAACSATPGSAFTLNRQKWEAKHITHYRFGLTVGCFCLHRTQVRVRLP